MTETITTERLGIIHEHVTEFTDKLNADTKFHFEFQFVFRSNEAPDEEATEIPLRGLIAKLHFCNPTGSVDREIDMTAVCLYVGGEEKFMENEVLRAYTLAIGTVVN